MYVAPGSSLNLKTLASIFGSLKCVFPIESTGPGMVSSKAHAPCGLEIGGGPTEPK